MIHPENMFSITVYTYIYNTDKINVFMNKTQFSIDQNH